MDERDWATVEEVLTEGATADMGLGLVQGRSAVIAFIRSFLDDCGPTQHLLGNLVVDVDGDQAFSRCYVSDLHKGSGEKSHLTFSTLGEYHDRWRRQDGRWWIVHRTKLNRAHLGAIEVLGPGPKSSPDR